MPLPTFIERGTFLQWKCLTALFQLCVTQGRETSDTEVWINEWPVHTVNMEHHHLMNITRIRGLLSVVRTCENTISEKDNK